MATTNGIDRERIPLMLIHGAWLSARSWENFADYFGSWRPQAGTKSLPPSTAGSTACSTRPRRDEAAAATSQG